MTCLVCQSDKLERCHHENQKKYFVCKQCGVIALDPSHRLSWKMEKARYESHENSELNEGYRNFLNQLLNPLKGHLQRGDRGLDFGSGLGRPIERICAEEGISVISYDPLISEEKELHFEQKFDFITCTEVIEHLFEPRREISQIVQLAKPKALIGFMTEFLDDVPDFSRWYYANDPTHCIFFTRSALKLLMQEFGASLLEEGARYQIYQKVEIDQLEVR